MRVCSVDGCDRKHRAKGLCAKHYQRQNPNNRHPVRATTCTVCEAPIERAVRKGRMPVCSYECRNALTYGLSEPLPDDHWARWYGKSEPWSPPVRAPRFVACECADCGETFLVDRTRGGWRPTDRYCSARCTRRVAKRKRAGTMAGRTETYTWAEVIGIWLAMGRRCAYCEQQVDGQPDPDHVVPLSRGGHNDITNILPSCRLCNSDKCDMTLAEWHVDRALRGKDPRTTDYATYDPRARHLVVRAPSGSAFRHRDATVAA